MLTQTCVKVSRDHLGLREDTDKVIVANVCNALPLNRRGPLSFHLSALEWRCEGE